MRVCSIECARCALEMCEVCEMCEMCVYECANVLVLYRTRQLSYESLSYLDHDLPTRRRRIDVMIFGLCDSICMIIKVSRACR